MFSIKLLRQFVLNVPTWRLQDFKYLGFEKDTDNILSISGDIGTYRYVYDGQTWKEQTDYDKEYVPDAKIYLINNLNDE